MPILRIRNVEADVDIRYELEQFAWTRAVWSHNKLLAASPFRYDKTPSFYVYLDDTPSAKAGSWGDSGAYDDEWAKGSFVKLLAFLRNETEDEAADYLLATYAQSYGQDLRLKMPKLCDKSHRKPIDKAIMERCNYRHPYLGTRGISERIQRLMGVGYDRNRQAVVLPWYTPDGKIANIKYRKTRGKAFWYEKDAMPIRNLVYGINVVYARRCKHVVICEAEIDAMSVMESGVAAIAVGGASFNEVKRDIILRSPIEQLTIMTDNDKAGGKLRDQIVESLRGRIELREARVPAEYKDVNETLVKAGREAVQNALARSESIRSLTTKIR